MRPPNKPSSSSHLWSSSSFMVLLLVLPLFLISVFVFTLGEARSLSWPPWKADKFLGYNHSYLVFSTKRPSELLVAAQAPLASSKTNETVLAGPQIIVNTI